jgi:hypothetical protein
VTEADDRLIGGGTWSCQDLMKYLVSVKDTLTTEEMGKLKHTNAFPLEQPLNEDGSKADIIRQKPLQLYEPIDTMRNLGLPVLDWGEGKWKPGSDEGEYSHFSAEVVLSKKLVCCLPLA